MIITKYPEWVKAQLKIIDERIEEIYREYMNVKMKPDDAMRIKRNLAERIKPFVDEKVRLISNSCPTYIVGPDDCEDFEEIFEETFEHHWEMMDDIEREEYNALWSESEGKK